MQIVGIIITTFHNIHNSVYNLVFTQLLLGLTHTSRIPPDIYNQNKRPLIIIIIITMIRIIMLYEIGQECLGHVLWI